ncbi:MAG: hypothetical protein AB7T22_04405 [Calditrichaceae bacterium]
MYKLWWKDMDLKEFLEKIDIEKVKIITAEQLEFIKAAAELITERDTLISGIIRVLKIENTYLLQETTNKSEITLRRFTSLESANELLDERMEIYEKMWDGCGCKIRYYS